MIKKCFLIAVLPVLYFVVYGAMLSAEERIFKKRDPRPRPLIAVRDESLALQNAMIDRFCLVRFDDRKMLDDYLHEPKKFFAEGPCVFDPYFHTIVKVESSDLHLANPNESYAILPTRDFMVMLGKEFYDAFHRRLKITDTLRTRPEQNELVRQQRTKADGVTHERESAHLTGAAFDISKRNMFGIQIPRKQIQWLERKFIQYMNEGKIVAVEEQYNNAFHVVVSPDWNKR